MRGLGRLTAVLVTAMAATALLAPGASAAKGRIITEPAQGFIDFGFNGTHGWRVEIIANLRPGSRRNVTVAAHKRDLGNISYGVRGHADRDGTIKAKVPGIGRIAVEFTPTRKDPLSVALQDGCSLDGTAFVEHGIFTGTVKLSFKRGLTAVDRTRGRGEVTRIPGGRCRRSSLHHAPKHSLKALLPKATLIAERSLDGGRLRIDARAVEESANLLGGEIESISEFYIYWRGQSQGVSIEASNVVEAGPERFTVTPAEGAPSEATIEPPAPFDGSAMFQLESPKKASWTGDLRVEVPTLGTVPLAGPRFWSVLCEGENCTDTGPPHFQFQFLF